MSTVEGTPITAKTKATFVGFTHVLTEPCRLVGFDVPAGATIYANKTNGLNECIVPTAVVLGANKLQKKARISADRGRWLLWGFLAKKVVQGGLTLQAGEPARVKNDGTVWVAFAKGGEVLDGVSLLEGTRLDWTGTTWRAEIDGEYVADAGGEDGDDEPVADDEADQDEDGEDE